MSMDNHARGDIDDPDDIFVAIDKATCGLVVIANQDQSCFAPIARPDMPTLRELVDITTRLSQFITGELSSIGHDGLVHGVDMDKAPHPLVIDLPLEPKALDGHSILLVTPAGYQARLFKPHPAISLLIGCTKAQQWCLRAQVPA